MSDKEIENFLEFGLLNIDKPSNFTSFDVVDFVRNKLKLKKASHFGTLDPKVTGVLPIALNRACKLTSFFMKKNKKYIGIMKVHEKITREKLEEEMNKFMGKIMQKPPLRSRVKRVEREREVFSWKVLEFNEEDGNVLFETEVEAGTYIRKLCDDLGKHVGGAHMLELRRVKAGTFDENDKDFINLYELEKLVEQGKLTDYIRQADLELLKIMKRVNVKKEAVSKLLTGKPIFEGDLADKKEIENLKNGEVFAVFCDKFLGVYKKVDEAGIIGRAEFVKN